VLKIRIFLLPNRSPRFPDGRGEEEPQRGAQNQDLPPSESITKVSGWKLHQGVGEKNDTEKGSGRSIGEVEFLHDHAEYGGNTHSDEVERDPSKPHNEPYCVVSLPGH